MSSCDFNYTIWLPTGPTGPTGPDGLMGTMGPTGPAARPQSIIFDGGHPDTDYSTSNHPNFDCGNIV